MDGGSVERWEDPTYRSPGLRILRRSQYVSGVEKETVPPEVEFLLNSDSSTVAIQQKLYLGRNSLLLHPTHVLRPSQNSQARSGE
jgi:hypothetical protein